MTQSEEACFKLFYFESINVIGSGAEEWKNIVLDFYEKEEDWLTECQKILDVSDKIKELHCLVNLKDY